MARGTASHQNASKTPAAQDGHQIGGLDGLHLVAVNQGRHIADGNFSGVDVALSGQSIEMHTKLEKCNAKATNASPQIEH